MSGSTDRLVAVDIGGTHARFVIATIGDDGAIALDEPVTLKTEDHASFQTAWEDFGRIQGGDLPKAVSIAVSVHASARVSSTSAIRGIRVARAQAGAGEPPRPALRSM